MNMKVLDRLCGAPLRLIPDIATRALRGERPAPRLLPLLIWLCPAVLQAQFAYGTNDDGTMTITGYTGPGGPVTIPSMIDGRRVAEIDFYAFQGNTNLTSLTISEGVATIYNGAFLGCTRLLSVTIPYSVTTIGGYALAHCTSLANVSIPNGNVE